MLGDNRLQREVESLADRGARVGRVEQAAAQGYQLLDLQPVDMKDAGIDLHPSIEQLVLRTDLVVPHVVGTIGTWRSRVAARRQRRIAATHAESLGHGDVE